MKVLAFTVALLAAALTAAPTRAYDDPVKFSKDANRLKDDVDQSPAVKHTKITGLGSIRVAAGGRLGAQNLFINAASAALTAGASSKNSVAIDGINNIVCASEFTGPNAGNPGKPVLTRLSYQEHRATGLAWLNFDHDAPDGNDSQGKPHRRAHRTIFLARICPEAISRVPP